MRCPCLLSRLACYVILLAVLPLTHCQLICPQRYQFAASNVASFISFTPGFAKALHFAVASALLLLLQMLACRTSRFAEMLHCTACLLCCPACYAAQPAAVMRMRCRLHAARHGSRREHAFALDLRQAGRSLSRGGRAQGAARVPYYDQALPMHMCAGLAADIMGPAISLRYLDAK